MSLSLVLPQFQVNDEGAGPAVAVDGDGDFIITWSSGGEVFAQYYNADGTADGSEFQVNDEGGNPAVAVDGDGNFIITWSATDGQDPGDIDIFAQRFTVTDEAENTSPTVSLDATASILENGLATLTGTITDPDVSDTFTLDVDWGDPLSPNNTETFTFDSSPTGSQTFTLEHQYLDDNPSETASDTYAISATVTDNNGAASSDTEDVDVNNVAPTITEVIPESVFLDDDDDDDDDRRHHHRHDDDDDDEGLSITVGGTFTDPGSLDLHTGEAFWSDGISTDLTIVEFDGFTGSFTTSRFFSEDELEDNFPEVGDDVFQLGVTTTITDDDTGTAEEFLEFLVSEEGGIV